jgi:HPt (histidine-containing phosphotransfer) domain-containing protein
MENLVTGVIDQTALSALSEATGDDPEFLAELIDTYLSDAQVLLATIEMASTSGDADELRRAAHSLKSNSATFGATTLTTLARNLEELGQANNVAGVSPLLAEARDEFARVEQTLRETRELL